MYIEIQKQVYIVVKKYYKIFFVVSPKYLTFVSMLTPEILTSKGFTYSPCGISGADQWQGMPFWTHKDGLILRGSCSTSGRCNLHLYPYFNTAITTEDEIDHILDIFIPKS